MFIYSEQARPYGLLSIYAYSPFTYNGVTWTRAADLIYGEFFQPGSYRDQMLAYEGINPSKIFYELTDQLLTTTFEEALIEGVTERLNSNLELRQELLKYSEVVLPEYPKLELVYNKWLTGGEQDVPTKKRLVTGLLYAIKAGANIPDDTPLEDLMHYKSQTSDLKDNDQALKYGANLIAYLKHRAKFEEQLRLFKNKILTQVLNHIIKQQQPTVLNLNKVRQERMAKMTPAQRQTLTEDSYQKYLGGHLSHLRLESAPVELPFTKTSVLNLSVNWQHPVYIYAVRPLRIGSRSYRSIIHYAYYKMFQVLSIDRNVSRYELHDLETIFQRDRYQRLRDLLIRATEVALERKFSQHPSLLTLLKMTGDEPLYWADNYDDILGTANGQGVNVVGLTMMRIRGEDMPAPQDYPQDPLVSDLYLTTWIMDRFKDVFNTLTLFKVPSVSLTSTLRQLYGIPKVPGAQPVVCPQELHDQLANSLLSYSKVKFTLVWDLLSDLIYILLHLTAPDRVRFIVKAQQKLLDPEANTTDDALKFLKSFYEEHRNLIKVNSEYTFAADITGMWPSHAKGPYNVFSDAKPARVKYFALQS